MQENLTRDAEVRKRRDGAVIARHRHMPHTLAGFRPQPGCDQFVVAPERAVEKNQWRVLKPLLEIRGKRRAGCKKIEILSASLVGDPQPKRIARLVAIALWSTFKIPGAFTGITREL